MVNWHTLIKLQGKAQGAGSDRVRAHSSPENDTGFAKVNDLYKAAMDDIEVMQLWHYDDYVLNYSTQQRLSNENSELYDQIEELKEANAHLREERSSNVRIACNNAKLFLKYYCS